MIETILPPDWAKLLKDQEEEIIKIGTYVASRKNNKNVFPKREEIFKCFWETPLKELKVIWIGEDPYPNMYKEEPVACGLSFMTRNMGFWPPSLRILTRGIYEDLGEGSLDWENLSKQGVLLLNTALTVEEKNPGSHLNLWRNFTINLIKKIQFGNSGLIFILLGKEVQQLRPAISEVFHHVVARPHPREEIYSGRKWEHENLWTEVNNITYSQTKETIKWFKNEKL